eukprot:1403651-Karenia_brevis.AAC.1
MARGRGVGKSSQEMLRMPGLSSGVSASTSRMMEAFIISRLHGDILELRERVERLAAILATGQQIDMAELRALAQDIGMDAP